MLLKRLEKQIEKENNSVTANNLKYNSLRYSKPEQHNHSDLLSALSHNSSLQKQEETQTRHTLNLPNPSTNTSTSRYQSAKYVGEYFCDLHSFNLQSIAPATYCLRKHQVGSSLRARMVDWMIEVMSSYKFTNYTFFKAIDLMDRYFSKETVSQTNSKMHMIGVTCIYMISKLEEVEPLRMSVLLQKIAHRKLTQREIIAEENVICSALNFNLMTITSYDIAVLVLHQLAKEFQGINRNMEAIEEILIFICKTILHSYETVSNYSKHAIGMAALVLSLSCSNSLTHAMTELIEGLYQQSEPLESVSKVLGKCVIEYQKDFPNLQNLKRFNKIQYSKLKSKLYILGY